MIRLIKISKKIGRETYLLNDKEAYIGTTLETEGAHGIPICAIRIASDLQQVIHDVTKRMIIKQIQQKFAYMCARRFIE